MTNAIALISPPLQKCVGIEDGAEGAGEMRERGWTGRGGYVIWFTVT